MLSSITKINERFLFFTGKGGVGKTSMACATSVALADSGKRVLLISTDPASNLDEVLETKLSSKPTAVADVAGLFAMNINPDEAAAAYRERIVGPYRGVLPAAALASIEEQLSGACTTEIACFNEFSRIIGDPNAVSAFDHVVLDTAPTGHTLRLLNLPAAWSDFIAENKVDSSCLGPLAGLDAQKKIYNQAVQTLKDPSQTTLVLVARADEASLHEAARAGSELREQGLTNQRLIINAIFRATHPSDPLAAALEKANQQALEAMPATFRSLPCMEVPFRPVGAVGLKQIRDLIHNNDTTAHPASEAGAAAPALQADDIEALVAELANAGQGVIMTMGKGGVGKTTLAANIARQLASRGHSVLLATTDPADHISGQFQDLPPNLTVGAIDPKKETQKHVAHVLATTGATLDAEARALLEEELRSPCIEEIAVFTAFAKAVAKGTEQFVVLDTAPTGHTLLLLDTTESYHREVSRNTSELSNEVRELLPRLRDPAFTRVLIVTLAEATPVHEAAALQEDLRRAQIEPWGWAINRTFYGLQSDDPLITAKQHHELPYLQEVINGLSPRTTIIPYQTTVS